MCILLNVKKHEKTFALNVDIFKSLAEQEFYLTSERIITILKTKGEKRRRRQ